MTANNSTVLALTFPQYEVYLREVFLNLASNELCGVPYGAVSFLRISHFSAVQHSMPNILTAVSAIGKSHV